MEIELWKQIDDFEDYEISNFGRVKKGEKIYAEKAGYHGYPHTAFTTM